MSEAVVRTLRSLSCVIPARNEAENLRELLPALTACLAKLAPRQEIIVVDDGSSDDTALVVAGWSRLANVRLLRLSRTFGKEIALTAGLDHAQHDAVIVMDADGQQPLATLSRFVELWCAGYEMVYGVRNDRRAETPWKRWFTRRFYAFLNRRGGIHIVPDAGDFRLMDRRVVEALRQLPERTRFMKGLYCWVGYRSIAVPFDVRERVRGRTHFNRRRLVELALTGLTAFTTAPLRFWGMVGAAISLSSMAYGVYIWLRTLVFGVDLPGWATLTVAISFLGGMQLLSIGVLGEYIGRIFDEVKQRPLYLVAERVNFPDSERIRDAAESMQKKHGRPVSASSL